MNSVINNLLREIERYQSNHFGSYDRPALIQAYNNLPDSVKQYLNPSKMVLNKLWRGCDGLSQTLAISFTTNKGYASTFGVFTLPFKELKSYSGLIDTSKLLKLANKLRLPTDVGDDEGEVIVLNPKWKPNLNLDSFR